MNKDLLKKKNSKNQEVGEENKSHRFASGVDFGKMLSGDKEQCSNFQHPLINLIKNKFKINLRKKVNVLQNCINDLKLMRDNICRVNKTILPRVKIQTFMEKRLQFSSKSNSEDEEIFLDVVSTSEEEDTLQAKDTICKKIKSMRTNMSTHYTNTLHDTQGFDIDTNMA